MGGSIFGPFAPLWCLKQGEGNAPRGFRRPNLQKDGPKTPKGPPKAPKMTPKGSPIGPQGSKNDPKMTPKVQKMRAPGVPRKTPGPPNAPKTQTANPLFVWCWAGLVGCASGV